LVPETWEELALGSIADIQIGRIATALPFYGPIAFGTSGRSYVRTDWPGGGFIGIYGTSLPELLPGRVSNGCIRLRNEDVVRLAAMLPIGTPVTVR
jgi:L,D-transpeptidase catalytic domain